MMRMCAALLLLLVSSAPAWAYVEAAQSLGAVIQQSTVICTMVVEKVDTANQLVIYRKVADIKGKHEQTTIKHNIGKNGLRPGEWQEIMNWAEVGKTAVFFGNGSASETFIGTNWYQAYPNAEWWGMSHAEPFLLRSYYGKADKLAVLVRQILDHKDVVVTCLVDGDKELLHKKTAKVQQLKASLKLQDYNPKRDFVAWGGLTDELRTLPGWGGFDKLASLGKTDADALAVSVLDIDGDGKPDVCLCGANKLQLMLQADDGYTELALPGFSGGARSAVWADSTSDGLPDLLLATPTGPRLYTNLGKAQFRDDTRLLPKEAGYNLTAAAWGDFNNDGKPDILLANGFHGLRLYLNVRPAEAAKKIAAPKYGPWHAIGPFRNMKDPSRNFDTDFEPEREKEIDLKRKHKGKRDMEIAWAEKKYEDGGLNSLTDFGANCATYLTREIDVATPTDVPLSLGAGDDFKVWLNGELIALDNTKRASQPGGSDQVKTVLTLKAGKNRLLLKVCNTEGDCTFYFGPAQGALGGEPWFRDVSVAWGLGELGLASDIKGDGLCIADFDSDGKPDVLFSAGRGFLYHNSGTAFEARPNSGLDFTAGKIGVAPCDFDGDGSIDLFVPQINGDCKLYRSRGDGTFIEVTARSGDLATPLTGAVSAAWGDFDNDGHFDLLVNCLRGPNRLFHNAGDGTFKDQTETVGLSRQIFNSQASSFADMNGDGKLDLVLHNEAQESCVLFAKLGNASPLTAVQITGWLDYGTLQVHKAEGKPVAKLVLAGACGRGGQTNLIPRFCLAPGNYTFTHISTESRVQSQAVTVGKETLKLAWKR